MRRGKRNNNNKNKNKKVIITIEILTKESQSKKEIQGTVREGVCLAFLLAFSGKSRPLVSACQVSRSPLKLRARERKRESCSRSIPSFPFFPSPLSPSPIISPPPYSIPSLLLSTPSRTFSPSCSSSFFLSRPILSAFLFPSFPALTTHLPPSLLLSPLSGPSSA